MADCVNCPDAGEFMERLIRENARLDKRCKELKQERDAIRDALVAGGTYCYICKKYISCPATEDCKGEKFEWCGMQKADCKTEKKCVNCDKTDGAIYTSNPPQVLCTITGEFHHLGDSCNAEVMEEEDVD